MDSSEERRVNRRPVQTRLGRTRRTGFSLELPAVGRVLKRGEPCAVVESLKTVTEIYAPASGKVIEVNTLVAKNPNSARKDYYGNGWLFKLELARLKEIDDLLTPPQYQNQL